MFYNYSVLSKCRLFERIPLEDLEKAIKCLKGFGKYFSDEETVYSAGADDFLPGVVLSGRLQVNQIYSDGSTVLLRNIEAGELFGVSLAYEDDENTFITSCGQTSVLFLHLPGKNYSSDCNCKYRMIILENLIQILAVNNRLMNQKVQILTRPTLREKLLVFFKDQKKLQKSNKLELHMTREKIAQYICAERSAVSRELGRMQNDGLISLEGKTVILN